MVSTLARVRVGRREVAAAERGLEAELGFGISDRKLEDLEPEELMNIVEAVRRVYAERGDCFGLKSIGEMYELDAERRLNDRAQPTTLIVQWEKAREMYHAALEAYGMVQPRFQIPGFAEYLEGRIASLEQKIKARAQWNYELRELPTGANRTPEPALAGR